MQPGGPWLRLDPWFFRMRGAHITHQVKAYEDAPFRRPGRGTRPSTERNKGHGVACGHLGERPDLLDARRQHGRDGVHGVRSVSEWEQPEPVREGVGQALEHFFALYVRHMLAFLRGDHSQDNGLS
jgi:hypothetical protein